MTEQRLAASERVPIFVPPIPLFAALGAPWVPRAHLTPAGESHRLAGKTDQEIAWLMPPSRRCPRVVPSIKPFQGDCGRQPDPAASRRTTPKRNR